jgi:hypothetical protein
MKFLANENVPGEVVEAVRHAGHDLAWVAESLPGADDLAVLTTNETSPTRSALVFWKAKGGM